MTTQDILEHGRIICEHCWIGGSDIYGLTIDEAIDRANAAGWIAMERNGIVRAFCPDCASLTCRIMRTLRRIRRKNDAE